MTKKIDLIIDALSVAQNSVWSARNEQALAAARELQAELAMLKMPTKIFGPNLEQILNAAGFYRREWVGLTDEDINKSWEWAQKSSPYGVTRIETFAKSIETKLKEKNGG